MGMYTNLTVQNGIAVQSGFMIGSSATIAANTANTQAAGTPVIAMVVKVTATAAGSILLPKSVAGTEITLHNSSAFAVSVFAQVGDVINALAANAALSLPTGTSVTFTAISAGLWFTVPRIPS